MEPKLMLWRVAGGDIQPGRPEGLEEGLRLLRTTIGQSLWIVWGPREQSLEAQPHRGPWSPPGGAWMPKEPWPSAHPPHPEVLGGEDHQGHPECFRVYSRHFLHTWEGQQKVIGRHLELVRVNIKEAASLHLMAGVGRNRDIVLEERSGGNCGSALIQVDVGRSSWPHDVPYEALLATASLMSPVESRQGINRTGVRMFKSGDFLSQARNELWDRVRVTCSQPFNKHTQFGLSFLRICTPEDESEHSVVTETQIVQEKSKSNDLRKQAQDWLSSPTVQKIFNGQMQMKCSSEATQTNLLSMDSTSNCCMKDLAFLSRTARMVISARQSQLPNRRMSGAESFHCEESNAQWREIMNRKMHFPPALISAIQDGNVNQASKLLQPNDGILRQLDDSEDRQWREALNLAIRLGIEDMFDLLLRCVKFDFRQIHEALLVAVDTNQPRVVKRLLDRLDQEKGNNKVDIRSFSLAFFDQSIDNSHFAPGVTPLTLACQKDLYQIVEMLTKKGHSIPRPHKISCSCLECRNGRQYDLLKFSLSRINTYRGIASRAYLSIASEDSMLSAFRLSRELKRLSKKEPEFKPQYLELENLCQEYAVELLGMCRNQSEVTTVLNNCEDSDEELDEHGFEEGIPNLARLRLAVTLNQKQFVAHPICQQVLSSIWCGNLSGWRGSHTLWKLLVSVGIFITMPLLCLIYWIAPKSKVGQILKIPVIKFLLHSASYLWFLIILLLESIIMEKNQSTFSTRDEAILKNSFHMIWVLGFFWYECKEVWIEGLRSYLLDWWNFLDIMTLSMYVASFTLRVLVVLKGYFFCLDKNTELECNYFTKLDRQDWRTEDPQFIAEVLFAVTSMLSFTRLAYILPAHESLGTLQISIGKMIDDMMRFNVTFRFLFWTMFGVADESFVDMQEYAVAQCVGQILYGIFTLMIVIVLLNMLVAMITNSFQKIEDDADVEWKFARSKLYLCYFREGLTLPVPFNIIPTPKAIFYLIRKIFRTLCCCCKFDRKPDYPPITSISNTALQSKGGDDRTSYRMQVIKALVQRYIETACREFEEARRKDVGNRITELNKVVGRLHAEMKNMRKNMRNETNSAPDTEGSSILGKYILGAKNKFRGFDEESLGSGDGSVKVTVHFKSKTEEEEDDEAVTSPTDSKASDDTDTGFGSQVGEDSIDGGEEVLEPTPE
ncbi:TRPC2 protein, partial [Polypterus senegalus]